MDNELEVIRHQMEEKRASLAEKLDALESQVLETVHEATSEVSHIVQEVKSTVDSVTEGVQETVVTVKETLTEGVQETVETVKQTLNLNDHIRASLDGPGRRVCRRRCRGLLPRPFLRIEGGGPGRPVVWRDAHAGATRREAVVLGGAGREE